MNIEEEHEEKIINCGVFNYSSRKLSNILGFDLKDIEAELNKDDSKLNQLLKKGKDLADYVIDLKLFEMAKSGDIKALDKLETRKKLR